MLNALPAPEGNIRDVRKCADSLSRLISADSGSSPVVYQEMARNLAELTSLWRRHIDSFTQTVPPLQREDPHGSIFCSQLQKDSSELAGQLEALCSAGWPRTVSLGITAMQIRTNRLLTAIFRQLEKERTAGLPTVHQRGSLARENVSNAIEQIPA